MEIQVENSTELLRKYGRAMGRLLLICSVFKILAGSRAGWTLMQSHTLSLALSSFKVAVASQLGMLHLPGSCSGHLSAHVFLQVDENGHVDQVTSPYRCSNASVGKKTTIFLIYKAL